MKKNENERLKIILGFIFFTLMGLGFLFVYHYTGEGEGAFTIKNDELTIKLKKNDIENQQKDLKSHEVDLQDQISSMELLLETITENVNLTTKLDSLIKIRKNDLKITKILSSRFRVFNNMDSEGQNDFLVDVYKFLSKEENPNLYVDFRAKANAIVNKDKIAILTIENEVITKNYNSLLNEIKKLREDNLFCNYPA